jgi:hypothetical protein
MPEAPLDIDNYFPEAKKRADKAKAEFKAHGQKLQRTNFGRYPDCQEVCDAFIEAMEWNADPYTIKQVAAGGRDFVAVFGNNPDLVHKTIRYIERNEKEVYEKIASPRSLITFARRLGKKETMTDEDRRRRYMTGEYADFWEDE